MTSVRALVTPAMFTVALMASTASPARAQCLIWSVTGVAFGNYDVFNAAPVDSAGQLQVLCIPSRLIRVSLSRGSAPTFFPRTLRNGANVLNYNLYLDAARSVIWGDGTAGTQIYQGTIFFVTLPIYGRVPALQDAVAGAHADTVVITVNF